MSMERPGRNLTREQAETSVKRRMRFSKRCTRAVYALGLAAGIHLGIQTNNVEDPPNTMEVVAPLIAPAVLLGLEKTTTKLLANRVVGHYALAQDPALRWEDIRMDYLDIPPLSL